MLRIAIGSDHRGFNLKEYIKHNVKIKEKIEWIDVGAFNSERSDYPEFTIPVCIEILEKNADLGILLCGTGVGMSVAANKFPFIYAALVWNEEIARSSKEDDNSNVLVLPADYLNEQQTEKIILAWLNAIFKGGRYLKRIEMIDEISELAFSCYEQINE